MNDSIRKRPVYGGGTRPLWMGNPDDDRPVLFETMTFDDERGEADERHGCQWRWHTWADAQAGHERVVDALRRGHPLAHVTTEG